MDENKRTLHFEARAKDQRFSIVINGKTVFLTASSFRYLMLLAGARILRPRRGVWINKYELDSVGDNQARNCFRMQDEIRTGLGNKPPAGWWPLYKSDRNGNYQLTGDPEISFDFENLEQFPDHAVVALAAKLKALPTGRVRKR
jgi:hypothetical protein